MDKTDYFLHPAHPVLSGIDVELLLSEKIYRPIVEPPFNVSEFKVFSHLLFSFSDSSQ
jgi:hypothetical protein